MASPHPLKRRRLNPLANNVNKPFVSPLRTPNATLKSEQYASISQANSVTPNSTLQKSALLDNSEYNARSRFDLHASHPAKLQSSGPLDTAARKAEAALKLQIRTIQSEIDTLTQALNLSSSISPNNFKDPTTLPDLTKKWRQASQQAAEEVFEVFRERVESMGGVDAWRASERRKVRGDDRAVEEADARRQERLQSAADSEVDSEEEGVLLEEQQWRNDERELTSQRRIARDSDAEADDERTDLRDQESESLPAWLAEENDDQVGLCSISPAPPSANSLAGLHDGDDAPLTGHRARYHRLR